MRPNLALGNVIGSNLANMLLILGIAALIKPVACAPRVIARDGSMVLIATLLFVGVAMTWRVHVLARDWPCWLRWRST